MAKKHWVRFAIDDVVEAIQKWLKDGKGKVTIDDEEDIIVLAEYEDFTDNEAHLAVVGLERLGKAKRGLLLSDRARWQIGGAQAVRLLRRRHSKKPIKATNGNYVNVRTLLKTNGGKIIQIKNGKGEQELRDHLNMQVISELKQTQAELFVVFNRDPKEFADEIHAKLMAHARELLTAERVPVEKVA